MTGEDAGSEGAAGSQSMIGRHLGRYTCVRELGAGGMATVYLARRTGALGFSKLFALKRIREKYAGDAEFTRMFLREAKLSASLDHPNIAQVVDFGRDGREHFLVIEYVHGPDLRRLLRASPGGRLPLPCAIAIMTRICAGLQHVHDRTDDDGAPLGLVHRDVSPTNILVSMDGAVKLADFGITKSFGAQTKATSSGLLVGKPGYMSPEQVRSEALDRRSDVFCLGILLYEMTTGHRCFFADNVFAVLNATQRGDYLPPRQREPEYPAALADIVARALMVDPAGRYGSARELQRALEELALEGRMRISESVIAEHLAGLDLRLPDPRGEAIVALPEAGERSDAGTAFMFDGGEVASASAVPSVARPRPRSPRTAAVVGFAIVVALVIAVAFVPWRSSDDAIAATAAPAADPALASALPRPAAPVQPAVVPSRLVAPIEPATPPEPAPTTPPPATSSPTAAATIAARVEPKRSAPRRVRSRPRAARPSSAPVVEPLAPPSRRHR